MFIVFFISLNLYSKWNVKENVIFNNEIAHPQYIDRSDKIVFLIHGFCSTPQEVNYLAEELLKNNLSIKTILLPGHGTNPFEMSGVKEFEIKNYIKKEFEDIKDKYSSIHVVGFSMGGAYALNMFRDININSMTLISPATYIFSKNINTVFLKNLCRFFEMFYPYNVRPDENLYFEYNGGKIPRYAYKRMPFIAIRRLVELSEKNKKIYKQIKVPTLIIHAKDDTTIDYRGSLEIYESITDIDKRLVLLPTGGHLITMNERRHEVSSNIIDFIAEK